MLAAGSDVPCLMFSCCKITTAKKLAVHEHGSLRSNQWDSQKSTDLINKCSNNSHSTVHDEELYWTSVWCCFFYWMDLKMAARISTENKLTRSRSCTHRSHVQEPLWASTKRTKKRPKCTSSTNDTSTRKQNHYNYANSMSYGRLKKCRVSVQTTTIPLQKRLLQISNE